MPRYSQVLATCLFVLSAGVQPASGQNFFVGYYENSPLLVQSVVNGLPMVAVNGKLRSTNDGRFRLINAPVFRPGLINLSDLQATNKYVRGENLSDTFNHIFSLEGTAKSDVDLKNCYVVVELLTKTEKGVVFAQIPDLKAGKATPVDVDFQLNGELEEGQFRLHFFSDATEVLHSRLSPQYVTQQQKKTADLNSGKITSFVAIPKVTVPAIYPETLKGTQAPASVRVRCTVSTQGTVSSAEILTSAGPELDAAALTAVRQWRFDPALKDGKFVESTFQASIRVAPAPPAARK